MQSCELLDIGVRHGYLRHLAAVIEPQPEVSK
jgi:hypothetical protein